MPLKELKRLQKDPNGNHHYLKIEIILKAIKKIPIDIQNIIKVDFAILFSAKKYQPVRLKGDIGPNLFTSLSFADLSTRAKRKPNPTTKNIKPGNIKIILSSTCDSPSSNTSITRQPQSEERVAGMVGCMHLL